jgi:uncharacterized protein
MNLEKYGPWALIIGGSEGIGSSFARKLAAKKFNVALVARKTQPLDAVATELRPTGVEVRTLSADLSRPDALEKVRTITDDIEIGYLIYVAGANSIRGNIVDLAPEVYRSVIAVNVLQSLRPIARIYRTGKPEAAASGPSSALALEGNT